MNAPNAKASSVNHIIKTLKGKTAGVDDKSWWVSFPTKEDSDNAKHLIMMLKGWSANLHPADKNTVRIFPPVGTGSAKGNY